jgi:uncharacterized coiled-coil protein SlyX
MTDMSIREAQTQVKNLLTTFRALKHFEAIIDTVASAEQRVADLATVEAEARKRVEELDAAITAAQENYAKQLSDFSAQAKRRATPKWRRPRPASPPKVRERPRPKPARRFPRSNRNWTTLKSRSNRRSRLSRNY